MTDMQVRPAEKRPTSRHSDMTGDEFVTRLTNAGWNRSDFGRLTGISRSVIDYYAGGARRIPVLIELAVEYIERFPHELLARPEVQTPQRYSKARKEAVQIMTDRRLAQR